MKQIKLHVTRTDEYVILLDESKLPNGFVAEYSRYIAKAETISDVLNDLGYQIMRFGLNRFIEGFGYLQHQRLEFVKYEAGGKRLRDWVTQPVFDGNRMIPDTEFLPGIVVRVVKHDDEIDVEQKEIA